MDRIEGVDLGDNAIDSIPLDIDQLSGLHTLSLWSNIIAHYPASLGDLRKLKTLDLEYNDMTLEEQELLKSWLPLSVSSTCRRRAGAISMSDSPHTWHQWAEPMAVALNIAYTLGYQAGEVWAFPVGGLGSGLFLAICWQRQLKLRPSFGCTTSAWLCTAHGPCSPLGPTRFPQLRLKRMHCRLVWA